MAKLVECVPNFSEGRDAGVIEQLAECVRQSEGVRLLDVDAGAATNRTVVTFVGEPESVLEAAVRVVVLASQLIDMRGHQGAHPRFGATDVCPFVPVANVDMQEVKELAWRVGERLAEKGLAGYFYERAARVEERTNLATVRQGEYEALPQRLADDRWKPDFGAAQFNPKTGVVAVGARDFLIAYNVNLNTTSTRRANAVAFDVRSRGRVKREDGKLTGKAVVDEKGETVWTKGRLECVKGIGWYIAEYGVCQVSLNLTDISVTSMHEAFDAVCQAARERGMRVTGSEIVGVVPLKAMLDAGKWFLKRQKRSVGVSDEEVLKVAVRSLGLDDLAPFDVQEKVIEYMVADLMPASRLVSLSVAQFVRETASESMAPGGGSASALLGALGAALATMVANLAGHKRGWDERWERYSDVAERGKTVHDRLLVLIDGDTEAFEAIVKAMGMAKKTEEEKKARVDAMQQATVGAIEVPLETMRVSVMALDVVREMAVEGPVSSVSDVGVGALCCRSAVIGAQLNVQINAKGLKDRQMAERFLEEAKDLRQKAEAMEAEVLKIVAERM